MIETTCGRVLFNEVVPDEVGFINELLTKKSLRDIIGMIWKAVGTREDRASSSTTSRTWAS